MVKYGSVRWNLAQGVLRYGNYLASDNKQLSPGVWVRQIVAELDGKRYLVVMCNGDYLTVEKLP